MYQQGGYYSYYSKVRLSNTYSSVHSIAFVLENQTEQEKKSHVKMSVQENVVI